MDQLDRQRDNGSAATGQSQAVVSLNREVLAVLVTEEAASIGRTVAQIVRGDGWQEAKASAVLVDALATWLGRDAVQTSSASTPTAPGRSKSWPGSASYYITGHGIEMRGRPHRQLLRASPRPVQPVEDRRRTICRRPIRASPGARRSPSVPRTAWPSCSRKKSIRRSPESSWASSKAFLRGWFG